MHEEDTEEDSLSAEKETEVDNHREKEHQDAEKVELKLVSRRMSIRRGTGRHR